MLKLVLAALVVSLGLPASSNAFQQTFEQRLESCETTAKGFDCYLAASEFEHRENFAERNRLLNRACRLDYTFCAPSGLTQMQTPAQDYAEPLVDYEVALDALERGCQAPITHGNVGPEACIRAAEIHAEGLSGGQPYRYIRQNRSEALRLYRYGCERHNDDANCVALASTMVDHFTDKQSRGEALELFRASCQRGNDTSCDRVARFIDY